MSVRTGWGDFYAGSGNADYLLDHISIHKDFLKEIFRLKPETAMEAGCGSAIMSIFLSMTGIKVTACDRDEKVLRHAAETANQWKAKVDFSNQDLLSLGFSDDAFDLSFSQGVLEHMSDDQIRQSCREVLRVSKTFIFSVPGAAYKHKDFGDERLMTTAQWKKILKGLGSLEMKAYYSIRTKRNFLMKRPLMLMGILCR